MDKDKRSEVLLNVLEFVSALKELVIRAVIQFRGSFLTKLKWPLSRAGKGCRCKGFISHQSIFLLNVPVFDLGGQQKTVHLLLVGFPEDSYLRARADVSLIAFPFYNNLPWPCSKRGLSNLEVHSGAPKDRVSTIISKQSNHKPLQSCKTNQRVLFRAGEREKPKIIYN